ncbi:MAG TPA: hypothetical protein VMH47_04170 [Gaiellaceae bacterium]|nr:hypothetical protein [Gaiellaceae bacterium]
MRRLLYALVTVVAAAAAADAFGAAGDKEQHKFTAADQAAAKTAVVQKTDLAATAGWTGGAKKPDLSPPTPCANYDPKQSDLVLTGAAETDWKNTGLELDTEAQVLQTAHMVALDWQRTVADPAAIACTKTTVQKNLSGGGGVKFVSFKRIAFPSVGTHSRAYLTTIEVTSQGTTVPITVEDVLIATKRTEITITSTTAKVAQAAVAQADVRLAKILVARAKA